MHGSWWVRGANSSPRNRQVSLLGIQRPPFNQFTHTNKEVAGACFWQYKRKQQAKSSPFLPFLPCSWGQSKHFWQIVLRKGKKLGNLIIRWQYKREITDTLRKVPLGKSEEHLYGDSHTGATPRDCEYAWLYQDSMELVGNSSSGSKYIFLEKGILLNLGF